jgi:hypothetical protein
MLWHLIACGVMLWHNGVELQIIGKLLQRFVVARRFKPGQKQPHGEINSDGRMLHIKIDGLEPMSKMELGVIV